MSSTSSTGKREWPVLRAISITLIARSVASRLVVRTRGVMISPAVRVPNSTDRSISSAVSASRVPCSPECEMRLASSVELRADRSSSCGSIPRRRTMALALPLRMRIGRALAVVNVRMKRWVARAVSIGFAIAKFLGTSSPNTTVSAVLITRPRPMEIGRTQSSGTPREVRVRRRAGRSRARPGSRSPGW